MIPLYNTSQIRNLDSFAIKRLQVPGIVLMENAAIGIYEAIIERINTYQLCWNCLWQRQQWW